MLKAPHAVNPGEPDPEMPPPDLRFGSFSVDLEDLFPDWTEDHTAATAARRRSK